MLNLMAHREAIRFDDEGVIQHIDFDRVYEINEQRYLDLHRIRANGLREEAVKLYDSSLASFNEKWLLTERLLESLDFPSQFRQVYE